MNPRKSRTINKLLAEGRKKISWSPTPFLDTELILSYLLKKDRTYLSANPDLQISEKTVNNYLKLISRRTRKEPIAYLIKEKEFFGLSFFVNKDVLIPRPETELLVEEAAKLILKEKVKKVVDIGTGSGCVILSLARKIFDENPNIAKKIKWYTTEISEKAIYVAKKNFQRIFPNRELDIRIIKGSLLEPIDEKLDLIISNPPYIGKNEFETLGENVRKYEPSIALLGGNEGYEFTIKLLKEAKQKLNKGGYIILEINNKHIKKIKKAIEELFKRYKIEIIKDYSGLDRNIIIKNLANK